MNTFLFPGVQLCFCSFNKPHNHNHDAFDNFIEINYCKEGRIGWDMGNGNKIFLGHGDFSIHGMKTCASSKIFLPTNHYEGIKIIIDLNIFQDNIPDLLSDIDIQALFINFCNEGIVSSYSQTPESEMIFSYFYNNYDNIKLSYFKLKFMELILYFYNLNPNSISRIKEYNSQQTELIHNIHDYLMENLGERITINELSSIFHINPTTLKTTFKAIYGDSIAMHMKMHRMKKAADLLSKTDLSLAEISHSIGYENQSKFSSAFKEIYNMLPNIYRKSVIKDS